MSFFGQNIRKIRIAKKLNQTEFANLFGLTRSAVGAYEEERAEPKLDKVIEIANYFGIDISKLLSRKLTINEILKYDSHNIDKLLIEKDQAIFFVDKSRYKQYAENCFFDDFVDRLPKIQIPNFDNNFRAFEYFDNSHFLNNEILICRLFDGNVNPNSYYLHIHKQFPYVLQGKVQRNNVQQIWIVDSVLVTNVWKIDFLGRLKEKD